MLISIKSFAQTGGYVLSRSDGTVMLAANSIKDSMIANVTMSKVLGLNDSMAKVKPTRIFLANDVTNNNASANTLADITGLSFDVVANTTYDFKFFIVYTSAATTTGSRWTINGPANTFLHYRSSYTLTATNFTNNTGVSAYNSPSGASASSLASGNICIIEGIIRPSANGTVIARFASEISASAIVAQASKSFVEYKIIN